MGGCGLSIMSDFLFLEKWCPEDRRGKEGKQKSGLSAEC